MTAGSSCIANAYTNNHELLANKSIGFFERLFLHIIDTIGIIHAMILRLQAMKVLIGAFH